MNNSDLREPYPILCGAIMLAVDLLALWLVCSYHDAHTKPYAPPKTHDQSQGSEPRVYVSR